MSATAFLDEVDQTTGNFTRIVYIGNVDGYGTKPVPMFVKAEWKNKRLSITGVIGPKRNGNATGASGQIDMEFNSHPNPAGGIIFAKGWNADLWLELRDIWKKFHLNDVNAGCEHQWDQSHVCGDICPTCGYSWGSKWNTRPVPVQVLETLKGLPKADKYPAWI